jgi:hypothetical protein
MQRRFTSTLVIIITLMSFLVSSSFAHAKRVHAKKSVQKEHVVKKKAHGTKKKATKADKKRHKTGRRRQSEESNEPETVKKGHRMKVKEKIEKEDSRIKVN